MQFIGRTQELKTLASFYDRSSENLAVVYGRRRVGKSELIRQSLKDRTETAVYFACRQTTEADNAAALSVLAAECLKMPVPSYTRLPDVLQFLVQAARATPVILVLDEFPYLRSVTPGIDSVVQTLLDEARKSSCFKLVLCGSYVETMRSLLDMKNPLYGRAGGVMALQPMDYWEAALFYPDFSSEDKVRLFSVFGGIPYYNRMIDGTRTVRENVMELIAAPGARFENEVPLFLRSEMAKLNNANEVFFVLADGVTKFSEILTKSHVTSSPSLADTLERLISMGLVEKTVPINDEKNKRRTGYGISDPLSQFYYRYIYRYESQRSVMPPERFYERFVASDFEERFVPKAFENVAKQYLVRCNRRGLMEPPFERIGRYWYDLPKEHRNGEFDVVTEDDKGFIPYEVKFRSQPLSLSLMAHEIEQVKRSPLEAYRYGFVSRSGFDEKPVRDDLVLIEIDEMYAEELK